MYPCRASLSLPIPLPSLSIPTDTRRAEPHPYRYSCRASLSLPILVPSLIRMITLAGRIRTTRRRSKLPGSTSVISPAANLPEISSALCTKRSANLRFHLCVCRQRDTGRHRGIGASGHRGIGASGHSDSGVGLGHNPNTSHPIPNPDLSVTSSLAANG